MTSLPTARALALEAVRRVIDEGAYSNRLIPSLLGRSGLDQRDRAFASELAYGTLRHRLRLDDAIASVSSRPVDRLTPGAAHLLRLGAYQLLVAGVAPHAAVGETVDLAGDRERGFVNAVLRRLADRPPALPQGADEEAVAIRTGLAPWAIRELRAILGEEAEVAAEAFARQAPLTLRATGERGALATRLDVAGHPSTPALHDPACLLLERGDPSTFPGFEDGTFAIQDQASVFVVRALDPLPGDRVLDLCAAPGGKALFATQLVGAEGQVVAADGKPGRTALIVREARRLRLAPLLVTQDATRPAIAGTFDRVLVDAPCSGVGSARRRPELLWRVPKDRLTWLAARQLSILTAASDLVAPGGRLVYSVCTFPRAETDAVVDTFLRRPHGLTPVATDGPDGIAERHRLWPHVLGTDGMFVAAFTRTA